MEETPEARIDKYRADLKFFMNLRSAVRRRYAEVVDFKEYEAKIQKLIDTHLGTGSVERVTTLVNVFDKDAFLKEVEKLEGDASKADTIAYRTKKTITERMQEDPAFYQKFSDMLEAAILAFRQKRMTDREYLKRVVEIAEGLRNRAGDDIPEQLRHHEVARAFYGVVRQALAPHANGKDLKSAGADAALAIDEIIRREKIVNWTTNRDVQNRMKNEIEDYLFRLKEEQGVALTFEEIDGILERCLEIARVRYPE
jgi:type I restriction enzyme R subunit